MKIPNIATAMLFLLMFAHQSWAEECDPAKHLKYEDVKYSRDIALQYEYLSSLSRTTQGGLNTAGEIVYDGIPIKGNLAAAIAVSLSKQLKIQFSNEERTWYTVSKLSEAGKEAYLACLNRNNNDNFYISVVGDPMLAEEFFVKIKSTPKMELEKEQKITVTVVGGGKVLEVDSVLVRFGHAVAKVTRNLNMQTVIRVKVGNDQREIVLPPRPNSIEMRTRSAKIEVKANYPELWSKSVCVTLKDDEQDVVLVEESKVFLRNFKVNGIRSGITLGPTFTVNQRSVCAEFQVQAFHTEYVEGYVELQVIAAKARQ